MTLRLRADLVLVALPPRDWRPQGSVFAPPLPGVFVDRAGVVVDVGAAVTSVRLRDRVIFDPYAAEDFDVGGWPCVLVPESALDAVVE